MATLDYDKIIKGIRKALYGYEVREYLAQSMDVPEDFPLVTLRSLFYTQSSTPILYSEEYYNTKLIPFSFQKRILTGKFNREQPPIELL